MSMIYFYGLYLIGNPLLFASQFDYKTYWAMRLKSQTITFDSYCLNRCLLMISRCFKSSIL